jgi:hypothetical protein
MKEAGYTFEGETTTTNYNGNWDQSGTSFKTTTTTNKQQDVLDNKNEIIEAINATQTANDNISKQTRALLESKVSNQADSLIKSSLEDSYNTVTANAVSDIIAKQFSEEIGPAMSQAFEDANVNNLTKDNKNELKVLKDKYSDKATNEDLAKEYALAMGYATEATYKSLLYEEEDGEKATLKDASGKETAIEGVSLDDMVRTLMTQ